MASAVARVRARLEVTQRAGRGSRAASQRNSDASCFSVRSQSGDVHGAVEDGAGLRLDQRRGGSGGGGFRASPACSAERSEAYSPMFSSAPHPRRAANCPMKTQAISRDPAGIQREGRAAGGPRRCSPPAARRACPRRHGPRAWPAPRAGASPAGPRRGRRPPRSAQPEEDGPGEGFRPRAVAQDEGGDAERDRPAHDHQRREESTTTGPSAKSPKP